MTLVPHPPRFLGVEFPRQACHRGHSAMFPFPTRFLLRLLCAPALLSNFACAIPRNVGFGQTAELLDRGQAEAAVSPGALYRRGDDPEDPEDPKTTTTL